MVVELGLSPQYVLDEMQIYEMQPLINKAYLKSRESWEQTRLICGYLHRAWFKGEPKMQFPWDEQVSEQKVTRAQKDALEAMMAREEANFQSSKVTK
jgi:hypothetical protein